MLETIDSNIKKYIYNSKNPNRETRRISVKQLACRRGGFIRNQFSSDSISNLSKLFVRLIVHLYAYIDNRSGSLKHTKVVRKQILVAKSLLAYHIVVTLGKVSERTSKQVNKKEGSNVLYNPHTCITLLSKIFLVND